MPAPDSVIKLCETFAEHRDHYRSGSFNEFQLRKQFLDPFFEALGWDMANSQGLAPQYRDVIHEDAIKIGPHSKAPDYAFTLHGQRKFFLEAKKPSVNIKTDMAPAYQLRRYAWSAKLPLSILSDFEEFAIYDTRIKPAAKDPSSKARVFYCTFEEYTEKWDEIAAIFSRDAILKGSFDKFADSAKRKKGTAEVDTAFLGEIERWREVLARNLARRNPSLSARDLNFAVQKTIDRLVFLRICEDRGTEDYGKLRTCANGTQTYARLLEIFRAADARYNSGLFHFTREKEQVEEPDTLTPGLAIDDKALKDIITHLYYPDSPYEFSVLPADILGSVYERFLGKTIRLTDGHQAKIEEKPEVRKAGGVYYTPAYIVDYIVRNTLGTLLTPDTGKPATLAAAKKLKVVDPACGSGSFLIVAYQYLLDWHRDQYAANPEKWSKGKKAVLYQAKGGEWRLTSSEKKRILLNNIHGVDIDAAAVEVTKLSLLLKVLEGETAQIAQRDFFRERERILPDLAKNIKCGNSLIGPDFYDQPEMDLLDDEARLRVNVFDWETAFPDVFKQGGFDCVIGNPPYLNVDEVWGRKDPKLQYLKRAYSAIYNDKTDLLFYFLALSLRISSGICGMIVSRAFLEAFKADKLRREILKHTSVREIIDFRDYHIFDGIGIATAIVILDGSLKGPTRSLHYIERSKAPDLDSMNESEFRCYSRDISALDGAPWIFGSNETLELYAKLDQAGTSLGLLTHIGQGMQTGANGVFGKRSWADIQSFQAPENAYYLRATNSDIQRYGITRKEEYLLYLEDMQSFESLPKPLKDYLSTHTGKLKGRAAFKRGNCEWWRYTWPLHREHYHKRRILCPYLAQNNRFALDENSEFLTLTDTTVVFEPEDCAMDFKYILGILNSKLLTFRFQGIGKLKGGGIYEYFENTVSQLPIRLIDFTNPADVEKHDRIVSLVERMLALVPKRRAEANPQVAAQLDAQIAATDRQIDRLVYDLYGLSDEEIALVEGSGEK